MFFNFHTQGLESPSEGLRLWLSRKETQKEGTCSGVSQPTVKKGQLRTKAALVCLGCILQLQMQCTLGFLGCFNNL